MNDIAIRVRDLGKRYTIGALQQQPRTLGEALARFARGRARAVRRLWRGAAAAPPREDVWALRHLDFEIPRGEVVGVVGRNGAGKSTLLKILSRITGPTEGCAEIAGRVGSLLEVGTGFHPELTGRENAYLSGTILGMRRAEIDRKFDEIVAFSEVDRYIDTPVKHYSSGMNLRLAFSVAAHLDPEILLIDEVLAVGDAPFQRKCLGKMEDVASAGRTVLFVSHNLGTVRELCSRGIVLEQGCLAYMGPVVDALGHYSRSTDQRESNPEGFAGWSDVRLATPTVRPGEGFVAEARLELDAACNGGRVFCIVTDPMGNQVVHRRIDLRELGLRGLAAGGYDVRARFPDLWLAPGVYTLFFKFLHDAAGSRGAKYLSERIVVDVAGSMEGNANAVLAPRVDWNIDPQATPRVAEGV